ncbi:MAG: hypothetical protein IAA85_01810 [Firmicutes bacterium]|nr:hypothetical protein [Candidatus Alectryobacillus merdavium]
MKISKSFSVVLISILLSLNILSFSLFSLNYAENKNFYDFIFDFSNNCYLFLGFLLVLITFILTVIYLFFILLSKKKKALKIVLSSINTILFFFICLILFLSYPITGIDNFYLPYLYASIYILSTIVSGFLLYKDVENEI